MMKKLLKFTLIGLMVIVICHLYSSYIDKTLFPSPLKVANKIIKDFDKVKLNLLYSSLRIIVALMITFVIGVASGLLLGLYPKINKTMAPIVYMSYPIPKMALLPFVMILFGFGEMTKIVMIILITVFTVIINVRDEVNNIESDVFDLMKSLGSSSYEIIRHIVLPAILPTILTTLRISTGISLSVLFFVENYGTSYGLGYSIMDYWMRGDYAGVYSSIILISIFGTLLYKFIDLIESRLCLWKKGVS